MNESVMDHGIQHKGTYLFFLRPQWGAFQDELPLTAVTRKDLAICYYLIHHPNESRERLRRLLYPDLAVANLRIALRRLRKSGIIETSAAGDHICATVVTDLVWLDTALEEQDHFNVRALYHSPQHHLSIHEIRGLSPELIEWFEAQHLKLEQQVFFSRLALAQIFFAQQDHAQAKACAEEALAFLKNIHFDLDLDEQPEQFNFNLSQLRHLLMQLSSPLAPEFTTLLDEYQIQLDPTCPEDNAEHAYKFSTLRRKHRLNVELQALTFLQGESIQDASEALLTHGREYMMTHGRPSTFASICELVLAQVPESSAWGRLMNLRGLALMRSGQLALAEQCFVQASQWYKTQGTHERTFFGNILTNLSLTLAKSGRPQQAIPLQQEEYEITVRQGNLAGQARNLGLLANLHLKAGHFDLAQHQLETAEGFYTEQGDQPAYDQHFAADRYLDLAVICTQQRSFEAAREYLAQARCLFQALNEPYGVTNSLIISAHVSWQAGQDEQAAEEGKQAQMYAKLFGFPEPPCLARISAAQAGSGQTKRGAKHDLGALLVV